MGIDISARLMYGTYYEEAIEHLTEDEIDELNEDLDCGSVDYASPYYDADRDEWFIGYDMAEGFNFEEVGLFVEELKEIEGVFIRRFKKQGQVQGRQHVY